MTSRSFPFKLGKRNCWAQSHALSTPVITLALHAGDFPSSLGVSATLTPDEARAMAVALEAAATHAENVLPSGLGESAVDAPAVAS